ncbi:MAG: class I mannose-6-phosphate isomerase [Gemmataceae bacterium]|nr:class I mannose-6-phosphate isomerase [Gemmataceae bacterium]
MDDVPLYPLRFEAIFQHRLWGGRRLGEFLRQPLPDDGPIGEAWVLSDQPDQPTRVANGPLRGQTLRQLMEHSRNGLLGPDAAKHERFPLLLKFLDARDTLSVQVHPDDHHEHLLPPGQRGKTEAWVVLHAEPGSCIYVGFKPGVGPRELRQAMKEQRVAECLASFAPRAGDCVFLPAGTVHALGSGLLLFEVQQNSDVTFRLHDWDRIDAKTGTPRQLHVEEALACIDFSMHSGRPVVPVREGDGSLARERLVSCKHFRLWRRRTRQPVAVGGAGRCTILTCTQGAAELQCGNQSETIRCGDVWLLPAAVANCRLVPNPVHGAELLECGLTD